MDTIFSAYKHEFPSGTLDYTSQFDSLAELYHAYRDLIEHWDRVLPGRVTHVRYEDMVHDMPNVARKIIEATGLEWDDSVLEFHKKKQAVNTLSTTQVRKGIYKDSLQAWRRYESHLAPLVKLIGPRTNYDLETSLKGYAPPEDGNEVVDEFDDQDTAAAAAAVTAASDQMTDEKDSQETVDESDGHNEETAAAAATTDHRMEETMDESVNEYNEYDGGTDAADDKHRMEETADPVLVDSYNEHDAGGDRMEGQAPEEASFDSEASLSERQEEVLDGDDIVTHDEL
jgi:Sulfotransferase family